MSLCRVHGDVRVRCVHKESKCIAWGTAWTLGTPGSRGGEKAHPETVMSSHFALRVQGGLEAVLKSSTVLRKSELG